MSGAGAGVAVAGIIAATIVFVALTYAMGRDMKFFSPPQCLGVMGRLRGHKYYSSDTRYIQDNCLRCGKRKG